MRFPYQVFIFFPVATNVALMKIIGATVMKNGSVFLDSFLQVNGLGRSKQPFCVTSLRMTEDMKFRLETESRFPAAGLWFCVDLRTNTLASTNRSETVSKIGQPWNYGISIEEVSLINS